MKCTKRIILALVILTASFMISTTQAQWTNDPWNGMVNVCNAPGNQELPQICRMGNGNYLIAWYDSRTSVTRLYYQVLNSIGIPLLESNGRPLIEGNWMTGFSYGGKLLPDGEGGCIAVFNDWRDGAADGYGQRFDSLGNRQWGNQGLPLVLWSNPQDVLPSDVAADSLGNFFVAWDVYMSYGNYDTYLQKFNSSGQRLWGDYGVSIANLSGNQYAPVIVTDGEGGVLDVWHVGPEPYHFYVQHLNANGIPLLPVNGTQVLDMAGQPMAGCMFEGVIDGEGGGVWCNWGVGGPNNYLYLFRLNGQGRTQWVWTNFNYCSHVFKNLLYHPVDGSLWLDVTENPGGVASPNLYRFNVSGHPLLGENGVPYGGDTMTPTTDGVITARVMEVGQNTRFLAQRTDSTGGLLWTSDIALGGLFQGATVYGNGDASSDNQDGMVIAFEDYRQILNTGYNLSTQRVLSNGHLGNPIHRTLPIYPATEGITIGPARQIHFNLLQAGNVKVELFDLLGRKIATLVDSYKGVGPLEIALSSNIWPSGMYFLHLTAAQMQQTVKVVLTK